MSTETRVSTIVTIPIVVRGKVFEVCNVPATVHPKHGPCVDLQVAGAIEAAIKGSKPKVSRLDYAELMAENSVKG